MSDAVENQALDVVLAALAGIATMPGHLTAPQVYEGPTPDSLTQPADGGAAQQIYVEQGLTEPLPEGEGGSQTHSFRAHLFLWLVTWDQALKRRDLERMKADVLAALFAAEAAVGAVATYGGWPLGFAVRDELRPAGAWLGVIDYVVDYALAHEPA